MRPVMLSERLRAVAGMVTPGSRVCDVGCDHGFIPIWLVEQGISPKVLAMDVRSGPLGAAEGHIAEHGLGSRIETRLSDGLHNYNVGEADTLICAGMGGGLMMRILAEEPDKTASFRELILQPQSEIEQFRAGLRALGYRITDERMIEEDGKFYPMMRAETELCKPKMQSRDMESYIEGNSAINIQSSAAAHCDVPSGKVLCKLEDRYGAILLRRKDQTLAVFLQREERIYGEILKTLQEEGLSDVKRKHRYSEVFELREECRLARRMIADNRQQ